MSKHVNAEHGAQRRRGTDVRHRKERAGAQRGKGRAPAWLWSVGPLELDRDELLCARGARAGPIAADCAQILDRPLALFVPELRGWRDGRQEIRRAWG